MLQLSTIAWLSSQSMPYYSMNKEQLIALATRKYHEQLQREYNYRQAIRDGLIERVESTSWNISDNH